MLYWVLGSLWLCIWTTPGDPWRKPRCWSVFSQTLVVLKRNTKQSNEIIYKQIRQRQLINGFPRASEPFRWPQAHYFKRRPHFQLEECSFTFVLSELVEGMLLYNSEFVQLTSDNVLLEVTYTFLWQLVVSEEENSRWPSDNELTRDVKLSETQQIEVTYNLPKTALEAANGKTIYFSPLVECWS